MDLIIEWPSQRKYYSTSYSNLIRSTSSIPPRHEPRVPVQASSALDAGVAFKLAVKVPNEGAGTRRATESLLRRVARASDSRSWRRCSRSKTASGPYDDTPMVRTGVIVPLETRQSLCERAIPALIARPPLTRMASSACVAFATWPLRSLPKCCVYKRMSRRLVRSDTGIIRLDSLSMDSVCNRGCPWWQHTHPG